MLELKDIGLSIDGQPILDKISIELEENKIGVLLGPSGSGKTTLLQCIAGFRKPSRGKIIIDKQIVSSQTTHIPTAKRQLGMMFQDYALFPHLTAEENIGFGIHDLPSGQRKSTVHRLLELTSMESYAAQYPHELSGGQQQRIALARALAPNPKLLLLDEPFSGLDADLKTQLIDEMKGILAKENTTALIVTHDQHEALSISDMLGMMREGRMLQWDSAYNVYHCPISVNVATLVGMGKMIRGRIKAGGMVYTALGNFPLDDATSVPESPKDVRMLVRPDDIIHDDKSQMRAVIEKKQFRGADFLYRLRLKNGEHIDCFAPSHHVHQIGEAIGIKTDIEHIILFPPEAGT